MSKLKILSVVVVLFTILAISLSVVSPAFAGTPEPARPVPGLGKMTDTEIRNTWLKKRAWYDNQTAVIRDAYKTGAAFQSLIDVEKKKGRDVYALEVALANFYGAITTAEQARINANVIFTSNPGFNGFYNVIDRNLAGQSIIDVHSSLKSVHFILFFAVRDFKAVYSNWKARYINR
ncbi:MAG: hypothetical protein RBS68_00950 [Anaerolineales bacterium]|jgi:hypothetical protein|nr:hypothetical protein [Anaerolineales bacterium]